MPRAARPAARLPGGLEPLRPARSTPPSQRLVRRFDPHYPARSRELNAELRQLLVYLQAPDAAAKTVALLEQAPTQEEQIDYARDLRLSRPAGRPRCGRRTSPGSPGHRSTREATASAGSWPTSGATRSPT